MKQITNLEVTQLMNSIVKLVHKTIDTCMGNVCQLKPAVVVAVSSDGLTASVKPLCGEKILSDIQIYDVRSVKEGDNVFILHWGYAGVGMTNCCILLGGNDFAWK